MALITTRDAAPSHLLLKIESFSLLDESGLDKYKSPEFDAGNNKWRLIIYPNGHGADEYVSVYLAISGTDDFPENWEVNAVFSIFILNQSSGNYHHTTGNTRRFFGLKTEWGVENLMSKEELMNPSNGYLIDDCCLFGAEVFVIDYIKGVTRCLSFKDVRGPYKHAIKISDFSTLKKETYWESEEFYAGGYKWKFRLYPKGYGDENEGRSLSAYLVYVPCSNNKNGSDERVKVFYTTCIKNQLDSNKNHKKTCLHWFDAKSIPWGWHKFISLLELNAAGGGFVVNDTCIFEIEITVQAVAK